MGNINIIAMHQLQAASSQQEALLRQVIEKVVEVEALAMEKLAQKLPVEIMNNLRERILILKTHALQAYDGEEMTVFPLALPPPSLELYPLQNAGLSEISSIAAIDADKNLFVADQAQNSAEEDRKRHNETGIKRSKALLKRSFFSKAKALLGFHHREIDVSSNYYPTISFKQKGRTAGSAYLQRWEIRLNPILLAENSTQFIDEVIAHEYAHLLTFALYGRVQPHGREWQMMMTNIMGLPANRTHCFNTDNSTTRRYERFTYTCLCQTHELTSIRHNRIQARKARYFCKHCGESLERREP